MSKLLLVLAVLCFASMAAADTTQIAQVLYNEDTCATQFFNTTYTAGACSGTGGVYSSMFCSNDGAYVYVVSYSDSSCNSTFATGMIQTPTSCGWSASKLKYVCVNPSAGPAAPFSFPPSGWTQSVGCVNATNSYKPASVCSNPNNDPAIHCTQSARIGGCQKTGMSNQPYVLSGCSNGVGASVYFTDSACTQVVGAVSSPLAGCKDGVQATCPSTVLPTLPTLGYQVFENDNCNTTALYTVAFNDNKCFSAQTYTCGTVNGTTNGILTAFGGDVPNALCTGSNMTTTAAPSVCQNKKIFSCNANPTPSGGAASSIGVSSVAMLVAAIVALIASLSL